LDEFFEMQIAILQDFVVLLILNDLKETDLKKQLQDHNNLSHIDPDPNRFFINII